MDPVIASVARAELRRSKRTLLGLAGLVALVVAVTIGAAAGARRTASTVDRLLEATAGRDVELQVDDDEVVEAVLGSVEALDDVEASGRVRIFPVIPEEGATNGSIDFVAYTSPDGGLGTEVDRGLVVEGRRPDPRSIEEVAMNEVAANRAGVRVGDRFTASTFTADDLEMLFAGEGFPGFNGPKVTFEVVGVVRIASDLQGSETEVGAVLYAGPAFVERYEDSAGSLGGMMAVRLGPDGSFDRVAEVARAAAGPDGEVFVESITHQSARDAVRVMANALWALAAVAALAGTVVVAGAVAREAARGSATVDSLVALGMCRRAARWCASVPMVGAGLVGALVGAVAAMVASPLLPFGFARRAEPDPGFAVDPLPTLVVLAVVVGIVALVAAGGGRRADRVRVRRSTIGQRLAPVLSLPRRIGVSWAFERHEGRSGANRMALGGSFLAAAGVCAALSFVASLDAVRDDPSRFGWGWTVEPDVLDGSVSDVAADVGASGLVDGVAILHGRTMEVGGIQVAAVSIEEISGSVRPILTEGREPAGAREVAVGEVTARELGVGIGDRVAAVSADGRSEIDLTVVGHSVFRDGESPEPGRGALLTLDGLDTVSRSEGFVSLGVIYPEGVDVAELEQQLAERFSLDWSVYSRPRLPGRIANLALVVPVAVALVGFFGLLGIVAVGHASAVQAREGRRELAVLRSLGMARRDARAVLASHAVAIGVVAAGVGIPVGIAAGRMVWIALVGNMGIVDAPTTPVAALAGFAGAALLGHWVLGRLVGLRRVPLAAALRQE